MAQPEARGGKGALRSFVVRSDDWCSLRSVVAGLLQRVRGARVQVHCPLGGQQIEDDLMDELM
jgi:hypothetical protein